jgi:hypothetical protein
MSLITKKTEIVGKAKQVLAAQRASLDAMLNAPLATGFTLDLAKRHLRSPHEAAASAYPNHEVVSDDVIDEESGQCIGIISHVVSDDAQFLMSRDALLSATAKVLQKQYPELKMANGKIIAIDYTSDGVVMGFSGTEIYEIVQFDYIGMMAIISDYGKGGPSSDVVASRAYVTVKIFGGQINFSLLEVIRVIGAGQNLDMKKMDSLKYSYSKYLNAVGYFGDARGGLQGLLTISGTTNFVCPTPISFGVNADYLTSLLATIASTIPSITKGIENPTRLVTPKIVRDIARSVRRYGSDKSVYQEFMEDNASVEDGIKEWVTDELLLNARNGRSICLLVHSEMDKLCLKVPQQFSVLDAQVQNFAYTIHGFGSTAGVVCTAPASIMIIENMLP